MDGLEIMGKRGAGILFTWHILMGVERKKQKSMEFLMTLFLWRTIW